jgi:transcriptional regulator with XRE-family HTH domain
MFHCKVKSKLQGEGMTQTALAQKLGVDKSTVTLLLNGRIVSPYLQRQVAELLGDDEESLWGDLYWFRRGGRRKTLGIKERR